MTQNSIMGVTAETLTLSIVEQCSASILFFVQIQTQWCSQDIAYARGTAWAHYICTNFRAKCRSF